MIDVRQSFVLTESRFPHQLIANWICKCSHKNRSGAKEHLAQTGDLRVFNVDQHDANENNADKEQTLVGNFSAKEMQHDRCGKDGGLPGGGNNPSRGERGAEGDEGIKDSETDRASENPKAPILEENIFDLGERFASLRDKDDHDKKDEHIPKA